MRTTITAQLARFAVVGLSAGAWQRFAPASFRAHFGTARHHIRHDAGVAVLPGTSRAAVAFTSRPPRGSR